MEHSLVHTLNQFFLHHDAVEDQVVPYVKAAEFIFLGVIVLMFLLARGQGRALVRRAAVAAAASAGVALLIAKVLATAVNRDRPFVSSPHSVHLFVSHAADPGFPSDHA